MHSLKNTHNHKKEPCEILQKKFQKNFPKNAKKNFPKKFQKKIEERLPRFSRSQIGGGVEGVHIPTQWSLRAYTLT